MKYLVSLFVGVVVGVGAAVAALYYNPFADKDALSPLAVSDQRILSLSYDAVPSESVLFTNDGESTPMPHPNGVAELWEDTIRNSSVQIVLLRNSAGVAAGIGYKFFSASEATRLLNAQALANSAWHIYLPGKGTMFVGQLENRWAYVRDVVVGARLNSSDNWRGTWSHVMTSGPNALGTAVVAGGAGDYAGIESEAVESVRANAYSAKIGPVAVEGSLTIALPDLPVPQTAQQN